MIETIARIYWEIAEDGGLLTGGFGCRNNPPEKHKYKILCKRPSCMHWIDMMCYIIFNTLARWLWLLSTFSGKFLKYEYEKELLTHALYIIEGLRRSFWVILRMDN